MRTLLSFALLSIIFLPELNGQEKNNGLDITFSLIHPVKHSLNEYKYSVDPTLEVLYFTSISQKIWVAGGLFAQAGEHNWMEFYGHTFVDDRGMPYPLRTDYSRQLEFFSLGIPVKVGMDFYNSFFNSFIFGFTAGNHLKLEMADYLNSEFIADLPVYPYFNSIFWELNLGLRKTLLRKRNFVISLSPYTGYRKESPKRFHAFGRYDYFFFGLGVNSRIGR